MSPDVRFLESLAVRRASEIRSLKREIKELKEQLRLLIKKEGKR